MLCIFCVFDYLYFIIFVYLLGWLIGECNVCNVDFKWVLIVIVQCGCYVEVNVQFFCLDLFDVGCCLVKVEGVFVSIVFDVYSLVDLMNLFLGVM